ncbi:MAG: hypothetical protein IE931_14365 [Sphingobacteriales bacterium]|nr:hypothetical protein [Sphingobacteriales bacterium]
MKSKIRITPLNIVVALCFTYVIYCILGLEKANPGTSITIKVIYTLALTLIIFITDILFRRFIMSMKWLWMIEGSFVLIIIVMMVIFQNM